METDTNAENASGWTVAEVRPGGRPTRETRPSPPRPSADRTPSRVRGFAAVTALRISRQSERPGFTSRVLTCRPGCPHGRARPRGGDRGRRHGGEREPRGREPGTSGLQSRGQARGSPSETRAGAAPPPTGDRNVALQTSSPRRGWRCAKPPGASSLVTEATRTPRDNGFAPGSKGQHTGRQAISGAEKVEHHGRTVSAPSVRLRQC